MPTKATAKAARSPPTGCRSTVILSHQSFGFDSAAIGLLAARGELAVLRLEDDVGLRALVVRDDFQGRGLTLLRHGQRALPVLVDHQVIRPRLVGLDRGVGLRAA